MNKRETKISKDSGMALMLTMVFIVLSLSAASLLCHRVQALMQVCENETYLDKSQPVLNVGMARALTLLETGEPPQKNYDCLLILKELTGAPVVKLSYERDGNKKYVVTVTSGQGGPGGACPDSFAGGL